MATNFRALVRLSLTRPGDGLAALQALGLPMGARLMMAGLGVVLEAMGNHLLLTVLRHVAEQAAGVGSEALAMLSFYASLGPVMLAAVGALMFVVRAGALYWVGRMFGGRGSWPDCLLTVAWYDVLWSIFLLAVVIGFVLVPPLAMLLFVAGGLWLLWVMVSFVAEVHGFRNRMAVAAGVLAAYVVLQLVTGMLPI